LRKESQESANQLKIFEIEMRNRAANAEVQSTGKGLVAESELATLKLKISGLDAKLQNVNNNLSVRERELQAKTKECELMVQQNSSLRTQLNEFIRSTVNPSVP